MIHFVQALENFFFASLLLFSVNTYVAAVLLWSPILFVFPLATTAAHLKSECTYLHPTERCWQSDMRFTHKMPNSRYLQSCKNGLNALKSYQTCLFTFFVHAKKELHCMEKLSVTSTPGESDKSQLWYQCGEDEKDEKENTSRLSLSLSESLLLKATLAAAP